MGKENKALERLNVEQRKLVNDNIGLVGVHMRRHLGNLAVPRKDREWDDLFQEGCLGLIQAVQRFRPERGIPFAAFAFPRIHNAVSRAIASKFCTIYVPPKRKRRTVESTDEHVAAVVPPTPDRVFKVVSLTDEIEASLSSKADSQPQGDFGETISQRVRDKYEHAVRTAGKNICQHASIRGDREALVRILVEERFMVPDDESKRALRQIARDTDSSYARVAQCDKQLGQTIGELLENDPEFVALQRRARTSPIGGAELIDEAVEGELILAAAEEVGQRFRKADPATKAHWLLTLLESAQRDTEELARTCFERLPAVERRRFLEATAQDRMDPRTKPGSKRKTKGGDPSESLLGATPTHGASRRADRSEPRSRSQARPSPAHETAPR